MEVNDGNLQALATYLQQTLSTDLTQRKTAEKYLESVEGTQNYAILLLTLLSKADADVNIRISAAITFKNFIKRNWRVVEDQANKICEPDRNTIKDQIVDLMLSMPENLQRQLSDAISIIGREDFPAKWPNLLPQLVKKLEVGDFHIINGVLRTVHSLFKRYRHEFKSQELWTEIKLVLDTFAAPLTDLFNKTMELAKTHANDPVAIKILYNSLALICKVFYSLNFQDLPEYFEDNMQTWMAHFHTLLVDENKLLVTNDEDEAGPLELLKSQICDNVAMYAQKYDEEFQQFLPDFVKAIWNLLVTTGPQVKFDILVSNAIQFLASVAERQHYKQLFESQDTLTSICEKVVVPNMEFREADGDLFEFNPEEYIRKDIEGSDFDTRRRSACDLVKALCRFFEEPVTHIFSAYVTQMLQEYTKSPSTHWKNKDSAIFLVTSLAAKSKTQKHGTTEVRELVNVVDFFRANIAADLQSPNVNEFPVLKADAIKYLITFRNMLPADVINAALPCLIALLKSESTVVHTYAALAIERIFTVRLPNGQPAVPAETVKPHVEALLTNLFGALEMSGSEENEYVMKAIMRSLSLMKEEMVPYLKIILGHLKLKLILVAKNPSKPHFNHYLFEAMSLSIRVGCKSNPTEVTAFETELFPPFQEILTTDVQEFIPYVFQIMSLMLELHKDCPEPYMAMFPFLLAPILWERLGNIPPLVRLLQAFVEKGSAQIVASDKVTPLLGVFQKLIASKANDHHGFYLIQTVVEHMNGAALQPYMKQVFTLLFQRLMSSKTTKFIKGILVFFCLYAVKHGAPALVKMVDDIQPKMFGMVLEKLYVPEVQKVSGGMEKKICQVGMTKLLTECPPMLNDYKNFWVPLLQALIGLFELPEDDSVPDDEHFIEIEDTPGYQTAYSQLAFAGKHETDPFHGAVPNAKVFLAQSLFTLSRAHPGQLPGMISTGLDATAAQFLQGYMHEAKVTLA
ncbi:exportin-2-like [Amphiura filiformis]|uniref:exportin-2-like n=1 Tax=Amphiura filiformis TaxID=82378 RepID=UPI003B2129BF